MRADAGFSLLELTVSLALLSMLMILAYGGITSAVSADARTVSAVHESQDILKVHKQLRGWLERAYPFDVNRATKRVLYPMSGDDRTIHFTTPVMPDDIMRRLSLKFEPSTSSVTLLNCPDWNDGASEDVCKSEIFLRDVAGFEFQYLETENDENRWSRSWTSKKDLPEAVKLSIEFNDDINRTWPDLIVAMRIDEQAHCNFDPVSRSCR